MEYIKTYDIIVKFKSLIETSLPDTYKLNEIKMLEFKKDQNPLPQIVQMTASVDNALNEIKIVFDQIADDLVTCKYDIVEKDQQILKFQRPVTSSLNISFQATLENSQRLQEFKEIEHKQKRNEALLKQKENELSLLESEHMSHETQINRSDSAKSSDKLDKKHSFSNEDRNQEIDSTFMPTTGIFSHAATYNSTLLAEMSDLSDFKDKYEHLEKKYQHDISKYTNQIK